MYIINNYKKNKFHNINRFKHIMNLSISNKFKKLVFLFIFILILVPLSTGCTNKENFNTGKWIVVQDEMSKKRNFATANLLPDGNVLIMGGEDKSADTADIFDPKQMKIVKTIQLNDKRFIEFNSISLLNGDIFVLGGYIFSEKHFPKLTQTTKLFNHKKNLFMQSKTMEHTSERIRTFLLKNGNVLILTNPLNNLEEEELKRKNMKFQIYNPIKNEYLNTKNGIHRMFIGPEYMLLNNGDILFSCYGIFDKEEKGSTSCLYKYKDNKFEIADNFPVEHLFIQLDDENYLTIKPEKNSSSGYVYNINTRKKVPVKNKIERTFYSASPSRPKMILLKDGNVLIIGISLRTLPKHNQPNLNLKSNYDYSTYLYNKNENLFHRVPSPKIKIDNNAASVILENGDVVVLGGRSDKEGKKIQIYKY